MVLTMFAPLKNEIRFLLTGNRISMQLKLRHVAEALAHASVDCIYNIIKKLDYKFGTVRKKKKMKRKYYSNIILLYVKITVEASKKYYHENCE